MKEAVIFVIFLWISMDTIAGVEFLSEPQDVTALVDDRIQFECITNNTKEWNVLYWTKNGKMVALGYDILSLRDGSIDIWGRDNLYRLIILSASFEDEANYTCEIAGTNLTQVNQLIVHESPSVSVIGALDDVEVGLGENLVLDCIASGRPQPDVSWRRVDNVLPSGEEVLHDGTLQLISLGRQDSGIYECIANNSVDPPASQTVDVLVKYPPTLRSSQQVYHTGPGRDVTLTCVFFASPRVMVKWLHNGSDIDFSSRTNIEVDRMWRQADGREDIHLVITATRAWDLGHYTCTGHNKLGYMQGNLTLSALPYDLRVISPALSFYGNQYELVWMVHSLSQLVEFFVEFKELNDSDHSEWHESNIPAPLDHNVPLHRQRYLFTELQANSSYVVRLQARNTYGLSDWTEFMFHTAEEGSTPPDMETTTVEPLILTTPNERSGGASIRVHPAHLMVLASIITRIVM